MKPLSSWKTCPTCEKLFQRENSDSVLLYVELEDESGQLVGTGTYEYCSETCMSAKLDTLGWFTPIHEMIRILKRNQISTSPNRWRVVCQKVGVNIEVSNG